jgi:hypothetical protein
VAISVCCAEVEGAAVGFFRKTVVASWEGVIACLR